MMTWRQKWAENWEVVKYCSASCRKQKLEGKDGALEGVILDLLGERARGATICPSEAARVHFGEDSWRSEMERTRCAARRLVVRGMLQILQKGTVVDPSTAKGPIRLRLN